MENILECSICLEKYNNKDKLPRILKCGHTFCSLCIKELTKFFNNFENYSSFVKCPIDKTIGHNSIKIEEIPINRIIVDLLDFNSNLLLDKLKLDDSESREKNKFDIAREKLVELQKNYSSYCSFVGDKMSQFMTIKNSYLNEISDHFSKVLSILENKKSEIVYKLEKFSKEKLYYYNNSLRNIGKNKEELDYAIERLDKMKNTNNQKNFSDEYKIINELGININDDKLVRSEMEIIKYELSGEFFPKLIIKDEFSLNLNELINSINIVLPEYNIELHELNNNMEVLNLNHNFYWFQQNSMNIYKFNINESDWILVENRDNCLINQMFRVSIINSNEALLTGGMEGYSSSHRTLYFKKNNFLKKQNMITARRAHSTCRLLDYIFVSGGLDSKGEALALCEKFNLKDERWYRISNMNKPKTHHSMCNVNNEIIYSIGGENRYDSLMNLIERYTVSIDFWEEMNVRVPVPIECSGCIQYKDEILILGGYSYDHGQMNSVYKYDLIKNEITKSKITLPYNGWTIYQPIKEGNKIHLFFGGEDEFPPQHVVLEYN